ncbi:hypothetical protein DL765_006737 [Monosporascus sp. GIB2]|nr:hypothetical protein DL765_006737 [Monosporascus sp. GIB2]
MVEPQTFPPRHHNDFEALARWYIMDVWVDGFYRFLSTPAHLQSCTVSASAKMAVRRLLLLAAASNLGSVLAAPSVMNIRDAVPHYPSYPNTTPYCSWWWDNDGSISCEEMPDAWGFTWDDFVRWNPSLAAGCSAYKTSMSFCVEAADEPPHQLVEQQLCRDDDNPPHNHQHLNLVNIVNLDEDNQVNTGDTCDRIASKNGITVTEFLKWNTNVGGTACNGLWANAYVCVSIVGHTPTPVTTGNGIATPTPTQAGMVSNCKAFYKVVSGDTCATIASKYKITSAQFIRWNPAAKSDCTGLWSNTYACVAVL